MEKILREVLAEDRNLLFRSNEFIFALERRIPPNLQRQFASIKAALKLNVGKFFATDKDDYIARYNVIKNLVEGGMNEGKINFVLKTFEQVLITDKESKEINRLQKLSSELKMEVTRLRKENSSLKKVNSDLQWQLEEISNDNKRLQKETSSMKKKVKKDIADYDLWKDGELILLELLREDRSLLLRNKELIDEIEKRITPAQRLNFLSLKMALENNVGEIFYNETDKIDAESKAKDLLKEVGMNSSRIDFVINLFENVITVLEESNIYDRFEAITLGASETSDENANKFADFLEETFAKSKFRFDNFVYPNGRDNKSTEKVNKAIATYANLKNGELGMVCCDITLLGSAEDGLLLTNMGIYVHNPYQKTSYFPYEKIYSIELKGIIVKDIYINGFKVITTFSNKEKENFVELLWHFSSHFGGLSKT